MSKRILVVEDQPDNRQIIRDMLASTEAKDGGAAFRFGPRCRLLSSRLSRLLRSPGLGGNTRNACNAKAWAFAFNPGEKPCRPDQSLS
jgi:CheY-like chemotaxis protein